LRKTQDDPNFVSRFTNFMTMEAQLVDRDQSPQELFAATGRKQYVDTEMVATIPRQAPAEWRTTSPWCFSISTCPSEVAAATPPRKGV